MDPVSAAASVIACYQLASEVVCQCLRYVRGVRQVHRDGDLVIAQIQMFHLSLHRLQGMLANEAANPNGGNRLKALHEIMNGNSVSLLLCSKELEGIRAKLVKAQSRGHLKEVFHKLSWPLKQEEVDRAMTILKSFATAVDLGLAIDSNELLRGIDSTTRDIGSTTRRMLVSTESAEAQQKQREKLRREEEERKKAEKIREQILDWLTHPDPSEIHNNCCHARKSSKTGRWLLDGAQFLAFKEIPRSVLWLHGDSGCGKTILCSAVIEELHAKRLKDSRIRLAYWYFSVNDANLRSLRNLVRALCTQLCPTSAAPPALVRLWDANMNGRAAPQLSDSVQALVQLLGQISLEEPHPSIFIVIDALDESDESELAEIIEMLQSIVALNIDSHLLITSRSNTVGVEERLRDVVKLLNVVVGRQHADEDILTHITERLENDQDLNKWSMHRRQDIQETLVAGAAGMFRWVDCQLHAIRRCRKPKELRQALASLPQDLREIYARELENVEDRAVEDVRKLLGWLTYPQRPLRIEEAAEMLAVDLDSDPPCFDGDNRMPRPQDILRICGSLVRTDKNPEGRNSLGKRAEVQTLTAGHASVVDFLKEERVRIGRESEIFYSRAAVNLEMAEICLAYLLEIVEGKVVLRDDNIMDYPLARFSAELWDDFYREVVASSGGSEVDMTRVNALVMRLFSSRESMLKWVQLCDPENDTHRAKFDFSITDVKSVMYYAALLGLPDIVRALVEDGHAINEYVGGKCGTPLIATCVYGREKIASILLDGGADPNLPVGWYRRCPLAVAIEQNEKGIFKLLLKTNGIHLNARRFETDPAGKVWNIRINKSLLYMAAESGSLEMVNSLLESGADADIQERSEWTPLQVACSRGSVDIVDILLEYGANARISGGHSGSPLQAACACPSLRIVKLLVGVPVDVNYVGDGNASALYLASAARDLEMVKLLIEHGASTNSYGGRCHNPLQLASTNGDLAIVKVLINAGIDVNRKGGLFGTSLVAACRFGNTGVVKILLEYGANPNIQQCGKCDNALQTACERDNADIVLQLLEYGADPNLHGGRYGSALHAAFSKGNQVSITALLKSGADVRYKSGSYCSVLQAAVHSGKEVAVQIALDCGLSANEKGGRFTYPLLRAIYHEECPDSIVKLLLEKGADPNLEREGEDVEDRALRTALLHATSLSKAELLLDNGAEVNKISEYLGTALHATIAWGGSWNSSMIRLLVNRGADVNIRAGYYGTPLVHAGIHAQLESARVLIEAGADLDSVDFGGRSALHMAVCSPEASEDLFDYFVSLGADPLLLDRRGCNGLHYAARANNLGILTKILARGPDINVIDGFGWTPLHWAAASTVASTKVIRVLLDEGCDKEIEDRSGRTALDLATGFGNAELIAILNATSKAYVHSPKDRVTGADEPVTWWCDGCLITPDVCGSEHWYECTDCHELPDLCFRCIVDKDVLHTIGHSWSTQPSSKAKASSFYKEEEEEEDDDDDDDNEEEDAAAAAPAPYDSNLAVKH